MNARDEKIKEGKDISDMLWSKGRDEYEYIEFGGMLNKDSAKHFMEELEEFLNKWDWGIFCCTGRIEKYRSRQMSKRKYEGEINDVRKQIEEEHRNGEMGDEEYIAHIVLDVLMDEEERILKCIEEDSTKVNK